MAPNVNVLTECIDILERYKFKIDNRVKELQKHKSSSKVLDHKKRYCKSIITCNTVSDIASTLI